MKDGKLEVVDLTAKDHITALVSLLVYKEVITLKEYEEFRDVILNGRNRELESELEGNTGLNFLFNMLKK
jgi:hypothetical protein